MKRRLLLLSAWFLAISSGIFAQAPQAMNYQAIVRDAAGNPKTSGVVGVRFTIHDTPSAAIVYQETTTATPNQFGLITTQIGNGGNLATVNWGNGGKFFAGGSTISTTPATLPYGNLAISGYHTLYMRLTALQEHKVRWSPPNLRGQRG